MVGAEERGSGLMRETQLVSFLPPSISVIVIFVVIVYLIVSVSKARVSGPGTCIKMIASSRGSALVIIITVLSRPTTLRVSLSSRPKSSNCKEQSPKILAPGR